jgi:formate--tetrahydrofolate ligase
MRSSLEIAQEAELVPIEEVAESCGLEPEEVEPYGRYKAKVGLGVLDLLAGRPDGRVVCVTGMTPTKAGEGKTTTLVGLTQGLGAVGRRPVACLREPSLGPVFGVNGGAGAGWLVPLCGDITQMPGLDRTPAALSVDIDADGRTVGLF